MSKDSYWFRHDANARNDPKMVALRRLHGWASVGIFWSLVEILREQHEYFILLDTLVDLAYDMRADDLPQIVDTCCDIGLLICDEGMISAPALSRNMEAWDKRRLSLAKAGRKGGLSRAQASTVEESTVHKSKEEDKTEYGTHVTLTDTQHQALTDNFGSKVLSKYIDAVNDYCDSSGKVYKDYAAAIRTFLRRDKVEPRNLTRCPKCNKLLPDVGTYCLACGWEKDGD